MTYISTKTYGHEVGLSCAFRQWRATSHCQFIHGYALAVRIEFEADELDERNWVVDFGDMKNVKERLVQMFDHKLLVARDDPERDQYIKLHHLGIAQVVTVDGTGCEAFAHLIFLHVGVWCRNAYGTRVRVRSVEVREHGANSAIYVRE